MFALFFFTVGTAHGRRSLLARRQAGRAARGA
jgi:hypothetical protein